MSVGIYEIMPRDEVQSNLDNHSAQLSDMVTSLNNFPRIVPENNDTGKLQRACDSLTNGGKLLIPVGNFQSGQITINYDNITIIGNGLSSYIQFVGTAGTQLFFATGRNNIIIENLLFDGNQIDLYGKGLLYLQNCSNSGVRNCFIRNVYFPSSGGGGSCAVLLEGTNHCFARFNKVLNVGYGIVCGTLSANGSIPANYNSIEDNYIQTTHNDAIFVTASLSSVSTTNVNTGNIVANNVVINSNDCGIESGINNHYCVIEGNRVYNSAGPNIMARNNIGTVINGNFSTGSTGTTGSYGGGINVNTQVGGSCRSIVVTNNTCVGNTGDGIQINHTQLATVNGNICENNGGVGIFIQSGAWGCSVNGNTATLNTLSGIKADADGSTGFGKNAITGNVCANNRRYGIENNGQYNTISGNSCYDDQGTKTQQYGIYLSGSTQCNFNSINSNICSGNADATNDIFLAASNGTGNLFSNTNIGRTNATVTA